MATTFKLEDFKELERALAEELPKATARNVLRRTGTNAMKRIEDKAKQLAPVHGAGHAGDVHLADHIATKPTKAKRTSRTRFARSSGVEVATGPAAPDRYNRRIAGFQEYGTVHHAAQPYMRPAADSEGMNVIGEVRDELTSQIGKAKARIAKKAAKRG